MGIEKDDFLTMWHKMIRINHFFSNAATRRNVAANINLTFAQLRVVCAVLAHFPRPLTLKELANHLNLTAGAVSQMVDTLCQAGFLERNTQENDRRTVAISLSENGQDISNEINTQIALKLSEYLACVPDEKLATFIEVLSILEDKLDQENNNNKEGVN